MNVIKILIVAIVLVLLLSFAQTIKNKRNEKYFVITFRQGKRIKLEYNSFWDAYIKHLEVNLIDWIFVILPL